MMKRTGEQTWELTNWAPACGIPTNIAAFTLREQSLFLLKVMCLKPSSRYKPNNLPEKLPSKLPENLPGKLVGKLVGTLVGKFKKLLAP